MNNSVFGKLQDNLRNRVNIELVTDARILRKRVAKSSSDSYIESTHLRGLFSARVVETAHV